MYKRQAIWFAVLSATVFFPGMPSRAENPVKASPDRFSLAVECVKRFEGWHGEKKHWPYVGWGHKVLPGERFTNSISKAQGDSILREDLRKLCRMFSYLGRDSLLAAVLSYNVGPYRLKGYGKRPKSRLLKKLESGDRNIYKEYVSFRCYKGKVVPSIERRRKVEDVYKRQVQTRFTSLSSLSASSGISPYRPYQTGLCRPEAVQATTSRM